MTLEQFFALYIENHVATNTRSRKDFERDYRLYLSEWGTRELASIKRMDVVQLKSKLYNSNGKSAANKAVELLCMVYNKAIDWEVYEGKNPAQRVGKFKIQSRDRFLQPEELPKFFDAVASLRNATTRDYFLMLLFTGQRRRNVCEMRWEDINVEQRVWRIPMTKNGTSHVLPLADEALAILARRSASQTRHPVWVFAKADGTGPIWCRNTAWKAVLAKSELENLRIHDLRRTLASWQAADGVSIPVIGRTLNHKDIKSTMVYARLDLLPVRRAIDKSVKAIASYMVVKPDEEGVS